MEKGAEPGDAIEALRARCAAAPADPAPRIALVRALIAARRPAEAVIPAEQAAALAPGLPTAIAAREAVLAAIAASDPNLARLELAQALAPNDASAQLALGDAYAALDRPHDAERCFKAALALGQAVDANAALGALYLSVSMLDAAEHHARAALEAGDGGDRTLAAMACQTLAGVARARGDAPGHERWLDRAYAGQSLFRQPAPGAGFTTLVMVTRAQGNTPYQTLMPPLMFDRAVWYMEHARVDQALPPYAVVLNAIGDADAAVASRAVVDGFLAGSPRPVLNAPARVAATFRHRLAETLAGIPGVATPETQRVSAASIADVGLLAAAAAVGVTPPMLVRPAGSHGGVGLALVQEGADADAAELPAGAHAYVSRFHDTRNADGFCRKYRVIFVDRRPFPYHLAISSGWMVHHETSGMQDDPARRAEELAFLGDPQGVLGADAMAAIAAIGERLDLDYAGIDFTIDGEGRVLVFEANATMLTHLEADDGPFAAKNAYVRPIIAAFQDHLTTKASAP